MRKTIVILTRVLLLFFAITLIDGGNRLIFHGSKVNHILADRTNTESEVPDNILSSLWDDVRWLEATQDKTELTSDTAPIITSDFTLKTIDFSGFIWQPPKFL